MKIEQWFNQHIEIPFDTMLCYFGLHRINWERWDGLEHCTCGKAIVDKDNFYEEQDENRRDAN